VNILYTLTSYPPSIGGAQQHFHEIARRLARTDTVSVVRQWDRNREDWLLGSTLLAPRLDAMSFEGVSLRSINLSLADRACLAPALPLFYAMPQRFTPWIARVFLKRLRAQGGAKPDLIHHGRIGRENLAYASLLFARELGVPFVLTPFHHPRWIGWRYREWLEIYRQADHVCALTGSERDTLISLGVRPERVSVTGHGPSVLPPAETNGESFREVHGLGSHPIVLFLGQKYPYKGFAELNQAATQVWERFPEARFVFAGPGTRESAEYFKAHRDPRVLELGALPLAEKCSALAACDLLCLPSKQESFGGVFVEAWTFSKPVIGGRIPAIANVIDEGKNGLLVDQKPAEIAAAIIALLGDPEKARAFGAAGREKSRRYSWDAISSQMRELYSTLVNP
jgi:glycosyltransferase involved in cell wall biosynthesis